MSEVSQDWLGLPSPWGLLAVAGIAIVMMYLGRSAAHAMIHALSAGIQRVLEMLARSINSAQERMIERNREVLLEMGKEAAERVIEREFDRVNSVVAHDLSGYPALHRQLSEQIQRINEDYKESSEAPPIPPEWVAAVESIASIPTNGDPLVGRILKDIHKTLNTAEKSAMQEYRKAAAERHRLLTRMLPFWRRLDRVLGQVDGTIRGLQERSLVIDQKMENYEQIRAGSERAVRMLASSSMSQFVAAGLVLMIAVMGGFVNFYLIALPMSEMVGATAYIGSVAMSDIAALVIILTEIAMGLFLMESLRITRMFPVIGTMDDTMRRRMILISFGILLTLACVEASLAYMRDLLAADREALRASLAGLEHVEAQFRYIPTIGQMVMGLMLPFALAFVAIPLESFIQSARVVLGSLLATAMRAFSGLLEMLGSLAQSLGPMLIHLYDFVIMIPLRLEQLITGKPHLADPSGGHRHEAY